MTPSSDDRPPRRLRTNSLRKKLESSEFVVGTFLEIPSPQLVELLGLAGFDFVVIDREHSAIDLRETEDLIRASLSTEISVLVRVADGGAVSIRQSLDMGASGLHLPQISSADMAIQAVTAGKYFPKGHRGLQPFVRSASYRNLNTSEYIEEANREPLMVAQVEGKEGIANLDAILAVDGVDVAFIGPYDLSQSLGMPGHVQSPEVQGALAGAARKCRQSCKWAGAFCDDAATAARYLGLGFSYLSVSIDAYIFLSGARSVLSDLRAELASGSHTRIVDTN